MDSDTDKLKNDLARIDGALEAITQLQKEIELRLEEESKEAAREALDNVITLLEAETAEFQKRKKAIVYQLREIGFSVEF